MKLGHLYGGLVLTNVITLFVNEARSLVWPTYTDVITLRALARDQSTFFWTPYFDFGHSKISKFTIEKIETGHTIFA